MTNGIDHIHDEGHDLARLVTQPTRRAILRLLAAGPRTVIGLAEELGLKQGNVSHHLHPLRLRRLVEGHRTGVHVRYHLTDAGRAAASRFGVLD
jgi:DNA-binding transcriptional ArsR family regulator